MAKSPRNDSLKVGFVTIAVVLAVFALLLWMSRGVSGDMQAITIRFASSPDMPTLSPGSAVLVGGQKIGTVTSTKLRREKAGPGTEKADQFFLFVDAQILRTLELKQDCRVSAEGPPLGGDGVVKLDLGTAPEPLASGTVILASQAAGFGAVLASLQAEFDGSNPASLLGKIKSQLDPETTGSLMAKLSQSLSDVNAISASLRRQFNDEDQAALLAKISDIAENVNHLTGALRREMEASNPGVALGKIHRALDNVNDSLQTLTVMLRSNEPRITRTMTSVEQTAAHLAAETDPNQPGSLMSQFRLAGDKLNKAMADVDKMTGTMRDVVTLNRENLNRMLLNFKEASDYLKTGVKYVVRHPWLLMNEPKAAAIRQQSLFDAARDFSDAASRIDDAAAQLRSLSDMHNGSIPVDDPDLKRIRDELKLTQERYRHAEEVFWKQLQAGG